MTGEFSYHQLIKHSFHAAKNSWTRLYVRENVKRSHSDCQSDASSISSSNSRKSYCDKRRMRVDMMGFLCRAVDD